MSVEDPTYRLLLRRAWPIILANAASPLLGLADTAVLGHLGSVTDLSAVALGALVFNFIYWAFGFLRMATTGFVAQASGRGDEAEVRATLGRALLLGGALGLALWVLQGPIADVSLALLGGSPEVETVTRDYLGARIWGAPAALASFALMGTLIGLGASRSLLVVQVTMNALNVALDVLFAGVLRMGAPGVGLGTAIADWAAALLALVLVGRILKQRHADDQPFAPWALLKDVPRLLQTLWAHADILLRTLLLLLGFGWFTRQGAGFGDETLAANHVLLQFISFSAFFLDGYAFVTESLVGTALGARAPSVFDAAVRRSGVLALGTAIVLAALWAALGSRAIALLTDLASVRELASAFLPYAATYVALSALAFQLDGIFIGATRTRDMRNAAFLSVAVFLAAGTYLCDALGNRGLWIAFILFVVARAVFLGAYYPRLRRQVAPAA